MRGLSQIDFFCPISLGGSLSLLSALTFDEPFEWRGGKQPHQIGCRSRIIYFQSTCEDLHIAQPSSLHQLLVSPKYTRTRHPV